MDKYRGADRDSGIAAYEAGADYIRVRFKDDSVYLYTADSTGRDDIEAMKSLADQGDGLNTYINRRVRKRYELREH
jgi:hypothetical protein